MGEVAAKRMHCQNMVAAAIRPPNNASVNSEVILAKTVLVLFNRATYDGYVHRKTAIVIGGGIVGLATAFRLEQKFPDIDVTVLEKESSVGQHQTGHNSGVLHAGTYYKPGSEKARLAVRGIQQMVEFCQQNDIRHEICGKLIVASHQDEMPRLHELFMRGKNNGLTGLEILSPEQMKEIEPHVAGVAALRVPQEGIVDYVGVAATLARKDAWQGGYERKGSRPPSNLGRLAGRYHRW